MLLGVVFSTGLVWSRRFPTGSAGTLPSRIPGRRRVRPGEAANSLAKPHFIRNLRIRLTFLTKHISHPLALTWTRLCRVCKVFLDVRVMHCYLRYPPRRLRGGCVCPFVPNKACAHRRHAGIVNAPLGWRWHSPSVQHRLVAAKCSCGCSPSHCIYRCTQGQDSLVAYSSHGNEWKKRSGTPPRLPDFLHDARSYASL
jgi:hypothetical protein